MTDAPSKSAARIIGIFELFERLQRPLTLSELVDETHVPQSTMSGLMSSLVRLGYMVHDTSSRCFIPSLRISQLGSWIVDYTTTHHVIRPLMQDLANATGETVILGVEAGIWVQYLLVLKAQRDLKSSITSGIWRPLCHCTAGLVLLSRKTDADIGLVVRRVNAEAPRNIPAVESGQLLKKIEQVRVTGYAHTENMTTVGIGGLAMMLSNEGDRPPRLTLGLGVLLSRLRDDDQRIQLIAELRKTVERYQSVQVVDGGLIHPIERVRFDKAV